MKTRMQVVGEMIRAVGGAAGDVSWWSWSYSVHISSMERGLV